MPPAAASEAPVSVKVPPLGEAETLAAHLLQHAVAVRESHARLEDGVLAEEESEAAVRREIAVLQAELQQYRGWISEEREGGTAYRLSKALAEERERNMVLERGVAGLRGRLAEMSTHLSRLQQSIHDSPAAQQARAADEALQQLSRLRKLSVATVSSAAGSEAEAGASQLLRAGVALGTTEHDNNQWNSDA